MTIAAPEAPPAAPAARKPRKIFLLVGLVAAAALAVGLFTSTGTSKKSGFPQAGHPVPTFTASLVNGSGRVQVRPGGNGAPTVLLFFGQWCSICRTELPGLAALVRSQQGAHGSLSHVRVIGVDSGDPLSVAKGFVVGSGVTFPVAYDPDLTIMSGDFFFSGDPYTVFVNGDGVVSKVVASRISDSTFTADERTLIATGS